MRLDVPSLGLQKNGDALMADKLGPWSFRRQETLQNAGIPCANACSPQAMKVERCELATVPRATKLWHCLHKAAKLQLHGDSERDV